jgi:cell division protein FtsN
MLAISNLPKKIAAALFLVAAVSLVSCATHKDTALVSDPNNKTDSTIPWNKPEQWESSQGQLQNISDRR